MKKRKFNGYFSREINVDCVCFGIEGAFSQRITRRMVLTVGVYQVRLSQQLSILGNGKNDGDHMRSRS